MKSSVISASRRVLALASIFAVSTALYAADAPVTVSETTHDTTREVPAGGPTVTSHNTYWVLDNGIVKAIINKKTGELESLFYKGVDRAGHDQGAVGPWEQDPSGAEAANALTSSITIDPAKNGGERAEVSVKGVTGGTITLTPNAPGASSSASIRALTGFRSMPTATCWPPVR
jgi:rhamnogalacturonan endolyase